MSGDWNRRGSLYYYFTRFFLFDSLVKFYLSVSWSLFNIWQFGQGSRIPEGIKYVLLYYSGVGKGGAGGGGLQHKSHVIFKYFQRYKCPKMVGLAE